jgi:hypothetical protein
MVFAPAVAEAIDASGLFAADPAEGGAVAQEARRKAASGRTDRIEDPLQNRDERRKSTRLATNDLSACGRGSFPLPPATPDEHSFGN